MNNPVLSMPPIPASRNVIEYWVTYQVIPYLDNRYINHNDIILDFINEWKVEAYRDKITNISIFDNRLVAYRGKPHYDRIDIETQFNDYILKINTNNSSTYKYE